MPTAEREEAPHGHSLTADVTEANYVERDMDQLHEAVCKIHLDLSRKAVVALPLRVVAGG